MKASSLFSSPALHRRAPPSEATPPRASASDRPCLVCGSATAALSVGDVALRRCGTCELVTNADRPAEPDQQEYYRNEYALAREELSSEGARAAHLAAERRRWSRGPEQLSLVADLLQLIQPPATLLDVGCDRAFFLDEARRHGFAVVGVEPSEQGRAAAQAIGIPMHRSLDEVTERVQGITLWHVLEHTTDPIAFLRSLHGKLEAGGVLAVRVPDFTCLSRRVLGARWPWFQPRNHLLHFSPAALRRTLEQGGFAVRHLVRRRPNNLLTLLAGAVAARSFTRYMAERRGWHARLAPLAHYLTLVEIYAIAVKAMPANSSARAGASAPPRPS